MFDALSNYISEVIRGKKIRVDGKDAQWRKVANIKVGDKIAVAGDMRSKDLTNFGSGTSDVFFDEIVSIKHLSPERVYDIEVEGTHNFVAGHFIDEPSQGTEAILTDEPGRGPPQLKDQDNSGSGKNKIFGGIFAHNTYISSSLGVGLSSPANKLDVSGGASFGSYAGVTAPSNGIIVSGNVGIGTTGPSRQLSINHTSTPYQSFMVNSTEQFVIGSETGVNTRDFVFYDTQSGYRMVIDTSGRVGIGSTAPDNKLDIDGAVAIGTYGLSLTGNTAPPNGLIVSGAVGIGTSIPAAKLDVTDTTTTGTLLNVSSVASITSAKLATFDWSPTSSSTATSDLFTINIGTNGTTTGNLFNITDAGSSLFKVSEIQAVTSVPASFTAAGDVSIAYDINFTNPTSSFIKSAAPLTIQSGEVFNSSDLTLQVYNSGKVMIQGTTAPDALLDVEGEIELDIDTANDTTIGVCKDLADGNTDVEFRECSSTPGDIAEYYAAEANLHPGDVVVIKDIEGKQTLVRTQTPYDKDAVGIVSTFPVGQFGKPLGYETISEEYHPVAIGLVGKLPVKVSTKNGDIKIGDPITTSDILGVAMKARKNGKILGYALESFDDSVKVSDGVRRQEAEREQAVMKFNLDPEDPEEEGVGKILIFINLTWYNPQNLALDEAGNVILTSGDESTPTTLLSESSASSLFDNLQTQLDSLSSQVASLSASLEGSLSPSPETASISATLNNLESRVGFLEGMLLTQPDASSEASIASSSATLDELTVSGKANFFDVNILNTFTSGLLTIDGIASDGATLSTIGVPLKIQDNLSANVEIMGGKVKIDTKGNLTVEETVKAKKFEVDTTDVAAASAGRAEIPIGETEIEIETSALTDKSLIFATPENTPVPISTEKTGQNIFVIRIPEALPAKLKVNWWIIN